MPALQHSPRRLRFAAVLAVPGPGLASGFADDDAGGIMTYSLAGLSQVLNGLLLPFVLVFVMLLADDKRVMGSLRSGRFLLWVGWISTIVLAAMSILLVISFFVPLS